LSGESIRSRVEGDKRTARCRGPSNSLGRGCDVQWPADKAVTGPKGDGHTYDMGFARITTMAKHWWCWNFDGDEGLLQYGLENNLCLMQYLYSDKYHTYQGNRDEKGTTKFTWRRMRDIKPGHWVVAYLPSSTFYAVGKVIKPRRPMDHKDAVEKYVGRQGPLFQDGIIYYTDAPAFYEDYANQLELEVENRRSCHPDPREIWNYNQRVDVQKWINVVPDGVIEHGLLEAATTCANTCRNAVFEIEKPFFKKIETSLKQQSSLT
jgi:hypothetical protein